jgi:ABC-type proline/glycine betaine transport system ATPase subunit
VLLLDEPLGALDQLTRMQMQDEILALWQARGTTMVLVTHYIDEAIYMSDRVVIMTPRPGRIVQILDVPLQRPRERNSPEFQALRTEALEILHLAESGGIGQNGRCSATTNGGAHTQTPHNNGTVHSAPQLAESGNGSHFDRRPNRPR